MLLSVQGTADPDPGPTLLDAKGELVWKTNEFGVAMNLKAQRYRGEQYLTFWTGKKEGSFGGGAYHMVSVCHARKCFSAKSRQLDSSYQHAYQVSAVGENLRGDLHEFEITRDDTAIITIYNVTNMDLTSMGRPVEGWIRDSIFQEIDIATGDLLFEWKASNHFHASESYMTHPLAGYRESIPFDFFHINSVVKDAAGNYLVSSRHLHSLIGVSPIGEILWVLGGQRNEFQDLSGGSATDFSWQHDGRWLSEEEGILGLFSNGDAGILHIDAPYSDGRVIQVDMENRTATLLHSYVSMEHIRAPSQGSIQVLPGSGNVFIGWGHSAAYSEFAQDGSLLCETHFGASALFFWGSVLSYRAYKTMDWVGNPEYPPSIEIHGSEVFVSWNGATEVVAWELQESIGDEQPFKALDVIDKDGFESSFRLPSFNEGLYYRVAALDRDGNVLGYSQAVQRVSSSLVSGAAILLGLGMAATVTAFTLYSRRRRRRRLRF